MPECRSLKLYHSRRLNTVVTPRPLFVSIYVKCLVLFIEIQLHLWAVGYTYIYVYVMLSVIHITIAKYIVLI